MKIIRAHRIRLNPNNKQKTYFKKACGVARFAYNWGLENWKNEYEKGAKISANILAIQFNNIKRDEFSFVLEVTKCAAHHSFTNLGKAFSNFFRNVKQGKKAGYPKFKKRGIRDSFYLANDKFKIEDKKIKIPKLGWVRMRESLRFEGKILSATVSRQADKWFVSISVEMEIPVPVHENQGSAVGIDFGIKKFATLSDGEIVVGPKPYKQLLRRLRLLNKSLSRKKKGSKNREKAKMNLSKLHIRIANIRNDTLHKFTSQITTKYHIIGIEDLDVKGMARNKRLARSILDMGWREARRQTEYKAEVTGSEVIVADRFYPSTQTCCICGQIHDMPLEKRMMVCDCGNTMDRDENAATNLENMAVGSRLQSAETVLDSSERLSMKQKLTIYPVDIVRIKEQK